jgi:hypothetical protein
MMRPSAFTRVGASRAREASNFAAKSASTPSRRAATAVPSSTPRVIGMSYVEPIHSQVLWRLPSLSVNA